MSQRLVTLGGSKYRPLTSPCPERSGNHLNTFYKTIQTRSIRPFFGIAPRLLFVFSSFSLGNFNAHPASTAFTAMGHQLVTLCRSVRA